MDSEEYWSWVVVSLFLLLTVDMLTSIYAVRAVGIGSEANIIMAFVLSQSISFIVIFHLVILIIVSMFFYGLRKMYERTNENYWFGKLIEVYLSLLIFFGLVVFANNISIIILRKDFIGQILHLQNTLF